MKTKKLLKKLIQRPLRFHHQDIHEELAELKEQLQTIQELIIKLLVDKDNDTKRMD